MTRNEKISAASLQLVIIHCLAKGIIYSAQYPLENKELLEPEMLDALKQLKNKASFLTKKIHSSFSNDREAKKYVEGAFDLTDEIAMQVIEAVEKIISRPKDQI